MPVAFQMANKWWRRFKTGKNTRRQSGTKPNIINLSIPWPSRSSLLVPHFPFPIFKASSFSQIVHPHESTAAMDIWRTKPQTKKEKKIRTSKPYKSPQEASPCLKSIVVQIKYKSWLISLPSEGASTNIGLGLALPPEGAPTNLYCLGELLEVFHTKWPQLKMVRSPGFQDRFGTDKILFITYDLLSIK